MFAIDGMDWLAETAGELKIKVKVNMTAMITGSRYI
jgi:hypothetical protein